MSYKGSYFISKCQLMPNGSSLEEEYDITRGNPSINYYESVTSPSISMTLSFMDIDQMISQEGITGGEMIDLELIIPGPAIPFGGVISYMDCTVHIPYYGV